MKRYLLLLCILGIGIFSCKKTETTPTDLSGNWRMIMIKDNATGVISIKPSTINGEVDINFSYTTSSAGDITGLTPTNTLTAGYNVAPGGSITIPSVAATKVMETPWGSAFLDNITSSQSYFFEPCNKLNIIAGRKTLGFKKL